MCAKSRRKGKVGELELAAELVRLFGCDARRGRQYCGTPESPDVISTIPGVYWECKRTEALSLYSAMEQAGNDAGVGDVPVICHRRNNREWLAICRLVDLPLLAKRIAH